MEHAKNKKIWLLLSIISNLSLLGYFKYANFFLDLFYNTLHAFGLSNHEEYLSVLLPMGISFYTFQSMSYTIDVYRGKIKACDNPIDFFTYLSFFPQLVAGPIVKAFHFLPQLEIRKKITVEDFEAGFHRILRGLFLKAIIADHISLSVNALYNIPAHSLSSVEAWTACLFFGIQIFCDFAGYSDIAIGLARIFGFKIFDNFNNPYLATSPSNYWQRWHISLSAWFREYIFYPIIYRYRNQFGIYLGLFSLFIISGLWHGAHIKFLIWGLYHGILMTIEVFLKKHCRSFQNTLAKIWGIRFVYTIMMFILILPAWAPFRAVDSQSAFYHWFNLFNGQTHFNIPFAIALEGVFWTFVFFAFQTLTAIQELTKYASSKTFRTIESCVYLSAFILLPGMPTDFIYFQF